MKTTFLILVLQTKKGHISSHRELRGALRGVAVLSIKVGPEHSCRSIDFDTMPCVRFGLLNCWYSVQIPSPLLGSLHALEVSCTSLIGWGFSSLIQRCKIKISAVRVNSFSGLSIVMENLHFNNSQHYIFSNSIIIKMAHNIIQSNILRSPCVMALILSENTNSLMQLSEQL